MLLFRSEEHVDRWCQSSGISKGAILTLDQAWRLAQSWYSPDRRAPDWRRKTSEEAEALFSDLGLTSDFWNLHG